MLHHGVVVVVVIAAYRHLRADDWGALLAILAVAAIAIFLIWMMQRSSDAGEEHASAPPGERDPFRALRPNGGVPISPAGPAADGADEFERKMRHNERVIEQRGLHHYQFAHTVLRGAFFENPTAFAELILSPATGRQVFIHLWSRAATASLMAGFEPLGFDVRPPPPREVTVAGRRGILFEMPPPEAPTEAYFTLALLPPDGAAAASGAAEAAAGDDPNGPLYFTLEKLGLAPGEQPADPPATILGSWSRTAHSNYGAGPPPTAEAFLKSVESLLARMHSSV